MQVFITQANAKKIEMGVDRDKLNKLYVDDLFHMSLWMLSKKEQGWLAALKMLYQNCEFFLQEFYSKIEAEKYRDSDWVFMSEYGPAYHENASCEKLHSDYLNYKIPPEICHRGTAEKDRFREWFKVNQHFLDENPTRFLTRLELDFKLRNIGRIEEFKANNSGVEQFDNLPLEELGEMIEIQLNSMKAFYDDNFALLKNNGIKSYYILKDFNSAKSREEKAQFDNKSIKVLKKWQDKKDELKTKLKTYLKVRFNPDLSFERHLLDQLGFHCCSYCKGSGNERVSPIGGHES